MLYRDWTNIEKEKATSNNRCETLFLFREDRALSLRDIRSNKNLARCRHPGTGQRSNANNVLSATLIFICSLRRLSFGIIILGKLASDIFFSLPLLTFDLVQVKCQNFSLVLRHPVRSRITETGFLSLALPHRTKSMFIHGVVVNFYFLFNIELFISILG